MDNYNNLELYWYHSTMQCHHQMSQTFQEKTCQLPLINSKCYTLYYYFTYIIHFNSFLIKGLWHKLQGAFIKSIL